MMNNIRSRIKNIAQGWDHFWFAPQDLYGVSFFRLIFGIALLGMYALRATDFSFFFLNSGVLPFDMAQAVLPEGYRSPLPFYFTSDLAMQIQSGAHYILLVLFTLGIIGRNGTWLLFVLNLGLLQRNFTIVYGADLFSSFWLLYLSLVNHNKYFSVLNLFRKNRIKINLPEMDSDLLSSVGIRLIQVQLCLSYAYTGFEKLKGTQWWDGTAVWHVIGMEEIMPYDLSFMMNFPLFIAILTMATVIFEVYFICAVCSPRLRPYWLLVGLMFHMSTAVFMDLWFFGSILSATYILFIDTKDLRFFNERYFGKFIR
jgi:hypothetical protein